jgi:hypothetical protein
MKTIGKVAYLDGIGGLEDRHAIRTGLINTFWLQHWLFAKSDEVAAGRPVLQPSPN